MKCHLKRKNMQCHLYAKFNYKASLKHKGITCVQIVRRGLKYQNVKKWQVIASRSMNC